MYEYVRALARPAQRNSKWKEYDLSQVSPFDIYARFFNAYIELSNPVLKDTVTLDMNSVRDIAFDVRMSFNDWLVSLNNKTLPTRPDFPEVSAGTVQYRDAAAAGYLIRTVDRSAHPDVELPNSDKEDLLLSKEGVDYQEFYDNCLVSVNGLYHRTSHTVNGIQVIDGNSTVRHSNLNLCGITSFKELGGMEIVDIDSSMLFKYNEEEKYYNRAHLNLGTSLHNKTVILVISGYMHVLDDLYHVTGDSTISIDFDRLGIVHRYIQSRKLIDMSDMDIEEKEGNSTTFAVGDVITENNIKVLLDKTQSFLVVLDNVTLSTSKVYPDPARLPGRYVSQFEPCYPLVGWLGKIFEYNAFREGVAWSIKSEINYRYYLKLDTFDWKQEIAVDDTNLPYKPADIGVAFFLKIDGDKLKV